MLTTIGILSIFSLNRHEFVKGCSPVKTDLDSRQEHEIYEACLQDNLKREIRNIQDELCYIPVYNVTELKPCNTNKQRSGNIISNVE